MTTRLASAVAAFTMLVLPFTALAHEHRSYTIGDKEYSITIGSMNEPVFVGDKSGVEFEINQLNSEHMAMEPMADGDDHEAGVPVVGLESSLKVEVSAGDEKMMLTPKPVWDTPGGYYASFFPSKQTTYTYRIMGTINGVAFDVPFTCKPAQTETAPEDTSEVKISDKVTQTHKSGAFGCPSSRTELEFPKTESPTSSNALPIIGIALSAAALALSAGSFAKTRKQV